VYEKLWEGLFAADVLNFVYGSDPLKKCGFEAVLTERWEAVNHHCPAEHRSFPLYVDSNKSCDQLSRSGDFRTIIISGAVTFRVLKPLRSSFSSSRRFLPAGHRIGILDQAAYPRCS